MIYGERIRFRHTEREDLPLFVKWFNDPEVRQGLNSVLPMSLSNEEKWFERMLQLPMEEQVLCIEMRDRDDWRLIGNCGFFTIDHRVRNAEVGIIIGEKELWNQGYGTEAMQLLLKHGFNTLNLNRIFLRVYENNPRAIRSYEKVGYVHEGRQRQAHYFDGQYLDVIFMSVLKDEWQAKQEAEAKK
ncbi:MAG: N-acetyltransferase [Chloroflexi bacterium]|nr:MAG: N-acetyltransferase [Chloroflexota bacterium]MBL1195289.1 N-acetyltransferase [Chloroflexota bacterium]NOH12573.1 GNAT family N-acetyltransferase [Chloroflexota bacterium]